MDKSLLKRLYHERGEPKGDAVAGEESSDTSESESGSEDLTGDGHD